MQSFRLEELLRYGFAGAAALLSGFLVFGLGQLTNRTVGASEAGVLVGLAFVIGTLIYAFHRAVIYPIIYRLALTVLAMFKVYKFHWRLLIPFIPAPLEVSLDFLRWKRAKNGEYAQPGLSEWGAQIHLLYCSSWAVLLTINCDLLLGTSVSNSAAKMVLCWTASIASTAAFVANCRLLFYDSLLARRDDDNL